MVLACGHIVSRAEESGSSVPPLALNKELVSKVVFSPTDSYFTYAHSNGFLSDGHTFVVLQQVGDKSRFVSVNPATDKQTVLAEFPKFHPRMFYTISSNNQLAFNSADYLDLCLLDVSAPGNKPRVIASITPPWRFSQSPSITRDGTRLAVDRHNKETGQSRISIYDVATGKEQLILTKDYLANHTCFFPNDPSWIMFARGGNSDEDKETAQTEGRILAWNAKEAPDGKVIFNQQDKDGKPLTTHHPVPEYHRNAIIFIVNPSPGSPHGLYEVTLDGHARCLSESETDMHDNMNFDGSLAVVDSSKPSAIGPNVLPKTGSRVSDIQLVDPATGKRAFLYRTTFKEHPYHAHPQFSLDGHWIVFNDYDNRRAVAIELNADAVKKFLQKP